MGLFVLKESDEPLALLKAALANLKISKRLKSADYLVTSFAIPYLEAAISSLEGVDQKFLDNIKKGEHLLAFGMSKDTVDYALQPTKHPIVVSYDNVKLDVYRSLTTKPLSSTLGLKSQYDWSSVPQGYDWLATNQDGTVKAFKSKPIIIGLGWVSASTSTPVTVPTSGYKGCWKFSREMRV